MKYWLKEGCTVGVEWARISALFSGSEEFCLKIRNKKDRWNSYIGSGMVSAVLRVNEGPIGVVQGDELYLPQIFNVRALFLFLF